MHRTARCIGRLESLAKPAGARPPRPRRWFLARARPTRRLSARSGTAAIDEACSRSPRADSSVPEHPGRRALESAHGLLYAATPRLPSPRTARHTDRPTDRGTGTRPDRRRLRRLTANARRVEPASRAAVRLERAQRVGVSVHDGMFFDDCRRRGDRSSPCPYDPATASCSLDKLIGVTTPDGFAAARGSSSRGQRALELRDCAEGDRGRDPDRRGGLGAVVARDRSGESRQRDPHRVHPRQRDDGLYGPRADLLER